MLYRGQQHIFYFHDRQFPVIRQFLVMASCVMSSCAVSSHVKASCVMSSCAVSFHAIV